MIGGLITLITLNTCLIPLARLAYPNNIVSNKRFLANLNEKIRSESKKNLRGKKIFKLGVDFLTLIDEVVQYEIQYWIHYNLLKINELGIQTLDGE